MTAVLDYYFSMVSPWAYIGHDALHEVVRRHDVEVNYKPMALLEVFDATKTPRLPDRHQTRKDYRMLELQRWREKRALPFKLQPAHWPYPFQTADCMVIAIVERGANPAEFMRTVLKGIWEEEKDFGDNAQLAAAADAAGLPGADLLEAAGTDAVRAIYAANTKGFLDLGGFGAPTYVLNGEIFWGQDRIDLLDDALASGRAPFAASG